MQKRLKWNAIGLERNTEMLLEYINIEKENTPPEHLKKFRTLQLFVDELTHLITTMKKIREELIQTLEKNLRIKFKTPEMVMLALSRPSIRNIYEDLEIFFEGKEKNPLRSLEYKSLASSGDASNTLALIGDAALDLAIVETFWDSSLTTAGELTKKRSNFVSNENLSKVCDDWNLYDYRLKRLKAPADIKTKEATVEHEKATLVEALFGVIYLELGFDELLRTVPFIQ